MKYRTKLLHIASLIVLIVSLSSCFLFGPSQQEKAEAQKEEQARVQALAYQQAITSVLQKDSTGYTLHQGDDAAVAVAMRGLDLSQCPPEFAVAYVDHMHAWEHSGEIQQAQRMLESDDNVKGVLMQGFLQKISGERASAIDDAFQAHDELKSAAVNASKQISSTFNEVERIAVAYGATLPQKQ